MNLPKDDGSALNAASVSGSLFDALDLPPETHDLQNAYWEAQREWEHLRASYHAVLHDLLARLESESAGLLPASEQPGQVAPVSRTTEGCAAPAETPDGGSSNG